MWYIPDGGLFENLTTWTIELVGHTKKVSYIEWHPTAADILLSAAADLQVVVFVVVVVVVVAVAVAAHNRTHSSAILQHLHWLVVNQCITLKLARLTHNTVNSSRPVYLRHLLSCHIAAVALLSSNINRVWYYCLHRVPCNDLHHVTVH